MAKKEKQKKPQKTIGKEREVASVRFCCLGLLRGTQSQAKTETQDKTRAAIGNECQVASVRMWCPVSLRFAKNMAITDTQIKTPNQPSVTSAKWLLSECDPF